MIIFRKRYKIETTRMWANAKRDGRPTEYRWRPLFNAAVWLTPTNGVPCSNDAKRETRWNLQGCPKLRNRSQPLVGGSSPYCEDKWKRYCCLTSFFSDYRYVPSCEDIARQICAIMPRWRIFGDFWVLHFQRAACSTFQTCILNSH